MAIVSLSDSLESRLDRIEFSLSKMTEALDQAPSMISIATDSIDEQIRIGQSKGIQIDERMQNGLQLLSRLSDPKIHASLNGIIDLIEQAPGLMAITADTIDESLNQANAGSYKVSDRINGGLTVLNKLTDEQNLRKINKLLDLSDKLPGLAAIVMDSVDEIVAESGPQNVELFNKVLAANKFATSHPPAKVGGLFGIFKLMKDKNVSKATGFLINFLKEFGRKL